MEEACSGLRPGSLESDGTVLVMTRLACKSGGGTRDDLSERINVRFGRD